MAEKRGRPTQYTPAIAEQILRLLADGASLREICRDNEAFPSESTIRLWAVSDRSGFSAQYARAREAQMERWADEILEIADDSTNDYITREGRDGSTFEAVNTEHINRSRLRVDTRKWLMSKLAPKRYGEKVALEHTGKDGGPIAVEETNGRELVERRIAGLSARAATEGNTGKPH